MNHITFVMIPHSLLNASDIGQTAVRVYGRLLAYRNVQTGQCNPRYRTVAKAMGVSVPTVERAVAELKRGGWLTVAKGQRGGAFSFCAIKNDGAGIPVPSTVMARAPSKMMAQDSRFLTELDVTELRPSAAADDIGTTRTVPLAQAASAAAPARTPAALNTKNQKTGPDNPLIRELADELIAVHPQPGLPGRAYEEIEAILDAAEFPGQTAGMIRDHHRCWREFWATVELGRFVPQLWRWLHDGEWKFSPVIRKGPARRKSHEERINDVFEELERRSGLCSD